jgi:hypothetical protein
VNPNPSSAWRRELATEPSPVKGRTPRQPVCGSSELESVGVASACENSKRSRSCVEATRGGGWDVVEVRAVDARWRNFAGDV